MTELTLSLLVIALVIMLAVIAATTTTVFAQMTISECSTWVAGLGIEATPAEECYNTRAEQIDSTGQGCIPAEPFPKYGSSGASTEGVAHFNCARLGEGEGNSAFGTSGGNSEAASSTEGN